jgi:hypothetical protein
MIGPHFKAPRISYSEIAALALPRVAVDADLPSMVERARVLHLVAVRTQVWLGPVLFGLLTEIAFSRQLAATCLTAPGVLIELAFWLNLATRPALLGINFHQHFLAQIIRALQGAFGIHR